jgi:predicted nucleic acid-binding Zn ribbon protein
MSFNSLKQIIKAIEKQPGWEEYQQYRLLCQSWQEVIDKKIAQNSRPLYIARKILWVATSSSTWAQELSLKRYSLLKQLNSKLPFQLVDIRFSPAKWHDSQASTSVVASNLTKQEDRPSKVDFNAAVLSESSLASSNKLEIVVQRWAKTWEMRSQTLPCCPKCHSPTPSGELKRWGLCHHCIAQKWSNEYQHNSRTDKV